MLQLGTENHSELEFADLPQITREDTLVWNDPPALRIALSSLFGGAGGALLSATLFPSDPALIFGAVLGAYGGFLATAILGDRVRAA